MNYTSNQANGYWSNIAYTYVTQNNALGSDINNPILSISLVLLCPDIKLLPWQKLSVLFWCKQE